MRPALHVITWPGPGRLATMAHPRGGPWLADEMIRDVPLSGTPVPRGAPICTIFATGETAGTCYSSLAQRARTVLQACLA